MKEIQLNEIQGFKIGHYTDLDSATGCSVILFDKQTPVGCDIRGGGPASRETPLLNPIADAKGLHAILLSGGSAYSLGASDGVMQYLEERHIGLPIGKGVVPLVCQSDLFDLMIGDWYGRPTKDNAYEACLNASRNIISGNIGVGMGCTVGKYRGMDHCMKSGLGHYAIQVGDLQVGAMVAVNALGDIYDSDTHTKIAGVLDDQKHLITSPTSFFENGESLSGNTTLGIIFTNAKMDKTTLTKVSAMAQNGYANAIFPVHTMADGDIIYACSLGELESDVNLVGSLASYVMAKAIKDAITSAETLHDIPSYKDIE